MSHSVPKLARRLLAISSFMVLASCGGKYAGYDYQKDPIDRAGNLTSKDYADQLFPNNPPQPITLETKTPEPPKAAEVVLTPQKPRIGVNKTVSISVTEDVPLKDVFIELARLADVDIEVDPNIKGGVIFKAKNRPFDEVIERLTDLAGLRYTVNRGVVRIEADSEYVENYPANFLNIIRSGTGEIGVSNQLASGTGSSNSSSSSSSSSSRSGSGSGSSSNSSNNSNSSGGSNNGSRSNISSRSGSAGDIWQAVQTEMTAIIGGTVSASSTNNNNTNNPSPTGTGPGSSAFGSSTGTSSSTSSTSQAQGGRQYVTINREAGIISVRTTGKNHEKIKEYLQKVKDYYSSQVLIEAKVLEVSLKDEFRSGVNWSIISDRANIDVTLPPITAFTPTDVTGNVALINYAKGDLTAAVELAQIFGTTKTLSSPRIIAMNNQPAVLTFTKNENYFSIECETTTTTGQTTTTSTPTVSSELHTIPIGVVLNMQPSIDSKNNEIILNVRPTLSRLTGQKTPDPAVAICAAQLAGSLPAAQLALIKSEVPQVDIREMDSILRIKSGEVMAIGGMIDQKNQNFDSGIPLLSDIPVIGNAFKTVDKDNENVQTVIFLKATIVPPHGVDSDDQRIYNKFNNDPRPLKF